MHIVFIMGPACSGKSTYIKNHFNGYTVIDLFDFQKNCWNFESIAKSYEDCKEALINAIKENKDVVMEHTLLRAIRRAPYIEAVREITDSPIDIICMNPSEDLLNYRKGLRGVKGNAKEELKVLEIPSKEEGFRKVLVINEKLNEDNHMYDENNKGFTLITNFGCDQNCKYCITKNHPILKNAITDKSKIDWNYLEECISNSDAPTINLSGGGDPFYNWKDNIDFYNKVYELANKYNKKLDIHTRILPDDLSLISKFRKIALSIEKNDIKAIENLKNRLPEIEKTTKIRVINVLNERTTKDDCVQYVNTMKSIGVKQITFRQMFGNKKAFENFEKLKNNDYGEGVMFLKDGEYHNYYFTTTNELYPYFFGYTEEDREIWKKKYEDIEQNCN